MQPPPVEDILEAARLAVATYFDGADRTKRVIRFDMESLRSLLRAYDSAQETTRLERKP